MNKKGTAFQKKNRTKTQFKKRKQNSMSVELQTSNQRSAKYDEYRDPIKSKHKPVFQNEKKNKQNIYQMHSPDLALVEYN